MDELQKLNIASERITDLVRQYNLNRNVNTIGELLEAINGNPVNEIVINIINELCPDMGGSTISVLFDNIQARYNELYISIAQEPITDEAINRLMRRVNLD